MHAGTEVLRPTSPAANLKFNGTDGRIAGGLFHDVQKPHFLIRREVSLIVLVAAPVGL
jgi:hypothetical protein